MNLIRGYDRPWVADYVPVGFLAFPPLFAVLFVRDRISSANRINLSAIGWSRAWNSIISG